MTARLTNSNRFTSWNQPTRGKQNLWQTQKKKFLCILTMNKRYEFILKSLFSSTTIQKAIAFFMGNINFYKDYTAYS
jgi:hypothetical protein